MRKIKTFILGLLLSQGLVLADTPPQIINKLCSANQFFSQIQPGPGNINCTQPTYSGIANIPSFINSLVYASNTVQFVNDTATPGNTKYYGTNGSGTRGWFDVQTPITSGNLTDIGTDGLVITGGTGAVLGSGTSLAQHVSDSTHNGYLSSTDWGTFNAKQAAGNYITALTGDVTATGPGSVASTLATVNSNVGSFGSSTAIPNFTVNGKGLITAAGTNVVIAPAGTLTGTTLASNVVSSSLTSVGTIGTGIWQGTPIADSFIATPYIKADGTRALTGAWNAGAFQITANSVQVGSAANTISQLATIINTGTLTLPTSTDTLVGRATTDTLTNKTLTGNTAANFINGSGTININSTGTITVPNATDTLVGKATTDTLTNKTLTGNTAVNLISGLGTFVFNTTGTITAPNATDTLVGKATTDTLTNKSMSGSSNTFTNIPDGALSNSYLKADGTRALTANWNTGAFQVQHGDGTANAPSISFASQTGLGFYKYATDSVALVGQDTTTFRVYNAGTNDDSVVELTNAGTSTGDQYLLMREGGITASQWAFGRDDSDSGTIKISQASAPGLNDFFTITTAGLVTLGASGGSQTHVANGNLSVTGTIAASNFSGTSSGTNTGDVTISSANGLSIAGQALSMALATGSVTGTVSASSQTFGGGKTFTGVMTVNPSTQNASLIQRYTNAGDGTGSTGLRVGNSGAAQGDVQFFYTNAAAAGSPTSTITFTPRNNADTTNTDAVRITMDKVAGNNGGEFQVQTSTTGGTLTNAFLIDSTQLSTFTGALTVKGDGTNAGFTVSTGNIVTLGASGSSGTQVVRGAQLQLQAASTSSQFTVRRDGADGSISLTGGTSAGGNGEIVLYGHSHATNADKIEFYNNSALNGSLSAAGLWTFGVSGGTQIHAVNGQLTTTKQVGLGGASTTVGVVQVGATNPLTTTNQTAVYAPLTGTSAATSSITGFRADLATAAASFTADHMVGVDIEAMVKGASSTITRAIGIQLVPQTVGTNNGSLVDNQTFTGSWSINFTSANPSLFGGPIQNSSGSTGAPSMTFSAETTKGFYSSASGQTTLVSADASTNTFLVVPQGANANAVIRLISANGGTGDALISFNESSVTSDAWSLGRDDSDSGSFVISQASAALGTNNVFKSTAAGAVFFPLHTTTGNSANAVLDSVTGALQRSTSSIRYKTNVTDLKIDSSKIYDLRTVSYDEKATGIHRFGLIAEEVEKVLPDLVDYIPENMAIKGSKSKKLIPDAVKYPMISVLLLKEVQKLRKEINELKRVKSGDVVVVPFKKAVGK